jgi:hypothetical protein
MLKDFSLISFVKNTKKRNKNPFGAFRPAGRVKYLDLDSVYLKPLVDDLAFNAS